MILLQGINKVVMDSGPEQNRLIHLYHWAHGDILGLNRVSTKLKLNDIIEKNLNTNKLIFNVYKIFGFFLTLILFWLEM